MNNYLNSSEVLDNKLRNINNSLFNSIKLKNVCRIIIGKTPSTAEISFWDNKDGYNWLTIRDITNDNISTEKKIHKSAINKLNLTPTKKNSLLFCFIGTLKLELFTKEGYYFNQAIAMLEPNKEVLYKKFLLYYLKTQLTYFKKVYNSSIHSCLSKKIISNLSIPLPPLKNQIKIINKIEYLELNIQKINIIKRNIFSLINKLLKYTFSDLHLKHDCKSVYLNNIVKLKSGKHNFYDNHENWNGKYPVYSAKTLNNGIIRKANYYTYNGSYIYFTTRGYAGKVFFIENQKFSITSNVCILIPNNTLPLNTKYLYYFLKYKQDKIYNLRTGTAIKMITNSSIGNILISLPKIDIQNKIVEQIDQIIFNLENINYKLKNLILNQNDLIIKVTNSLINKFQFYL